MHLNPKKSMIKPKNIDYIKYKEKRGEYTLSMDGELVEKLLILMNRRMPEFGILNYRFLGIKYFDSDTYAIIIKPYRTKAFTTIYEN